MKTVWIVNYYSALPKYDTHLRHLEFAHYLSQEGYFVRIFNRSFLVQENRQLVKGVQLFANEDCGEFHFTHVKSWNGSGNGIRRAVSIFQFAINLILIRKKFERPNIILHNIHVPFDYPVILCAKFLHCKYIAETWDLWPNDFVTAGLISKDNIFLPLAYRIERKIYEKATAIIFSFEGGIDYLGERHLTILHGGKIDEKKIFYINNGIDIDKFNSDKENHKIVDSDLLDDNFFKIVYLGSIQLSNDIKQLIDCANVLKGDRRFKFLIYGDGSERNFLEHYCSQNRIDNVYFKQKHIPLEDVPFVVSCASLNILNYKRNVGRYGMSPGKFFQYLAAAKPICSNIAVKYSIINEFNLGVEKDLNTPDLYADSIRRIADLSNDDYNSMCNRVRATASLYDYKILFKKFLEVVGYCDKNI